MVARTGYLHLREKPLTSGILAGVLKLHGAGIFI
jgi:hypothetical protein